MNYDNAVRIAVNALKVYEGFRANAYWDVNGYAIGYGNHYYKNGTAVQKGDTISLKDAVELLPVIASQKERAIRNYVTAPLLDSQYAALISLAYNCGEGNVRDSKVLKLINGRAPKADIYSQWIKTCITSKGEYNPDLKERRLNEWQTLWEKGSASINYILFAIAVYGLYRLSRR